eukprot:365075-Chlamydomonas_euryale.AAC.9
MEHAPMQRPAWRRFPRPNQASGDIKIWQKPRICDRSVDALRESDLRRARPLLQIFGEGRKPLHQRATNTFLWL